MHVRSEYDGERGHFGGRGRNRGQFGSSRHNESSTNSGRHPFSSRSDHDRDYDNNYNSDRNDKFKGGFHKNGGDPKDHKPKEFYIPPEENEEQLFSSGISSGINFANYDNIPVKVRDVQRNKQQSYSKILMFSFRYFR